MVFSITVWVEPEPSYPFSTPTDNCNSKWFGTHIYWYGTILLVLCNKETDLVGRCIPSRKIDNGLFVTKYEKYSAVPVDMCTKPF